MFFILCFQNAAVLLYCCSLFLCFSVDDIDGFLSLGKIYSIIFVSG